MEFVNGVPNLGNWSKQQKHSDLNDLFVDRVYHKFTKFILIVFSLGVFLYRLVGKALNCEYTIIIILIDLSIINDILNRFFP